MKKTRTPKVKKIALAVFREGKILLVREEKEEVFYFLGGTLEEGETHITCLKREVQEELSVEVAEESLRFLGEFKGKTLTIHLYAGEILGTPQPSQEIVEARFFDSTIKPHLLTPIGRRAFRWLKEKGYIR